ncbi:MAG: TIGR03032 family protein [Methyloceanibacter sp.]
MAGKKASRGGKNGKASKPAAKRTAKRSKPVVKNAAPAEADAPTAAAEAQGAAPQPGAAPADQQQTTISTSRGFVDFLVTNRLSIALTSYQTGQLMLIGPLLDGRLSVFQRNFVRAMGLWASPQRLYLSSIAQIWRLENVLGPGQLANQKQLHYERLYVPRFSYTTGDIDAHELGIDKNDQLIFVNTKYSCLATPDTVHSFKPLWKPHYISKIAPEDRCHLNGLAMKDGAPKYVTAVSRSDVVDGWRERRHEGGILIDVENDRILTEDLSMPHSPRLNDGTLWVLDSGRGYLCRVDTKSGKAEQVAFCPGFARGLSFWRGYALFGTSLPRDGAFKGLELDDNVKARDGEPRCGAYIVDTRTGDIMHWIRFEGAVRELFDAAFIPGVRAPMCVGLGNPEMRTLITFAGDTTSSKAEVAA